MLAPHSWKVERLSPTVLKLTTEITGKNKDFFRANLLQSDEHFDHPGCNRELLAYHNKQAVERDAGIFRFGDTYCAMQGKFDPRSSKKDLRPEYLGRDYFDAIIADYVEFNQPCQDNIVMLGTGNHESSIKKRQETNLIDRTAAQLRTNSGKPVQAMGYAGWIIFQIKWGKRNYKTFRLFYHHGSGGEAPVTKGVLAATKQANYLPDADIVVSGHNHEHWIFPVTRTRIKDSGVTYLDQQTHVKCSTYKEEFLCLNNWHVEMGKSPKPVGSMVWMNFYWNPRRKEPAVRFEQTETE